EYWVYRGGDRLAPNYRLSAADLADIGGTRDRKRYAGRYLRKALDPKGTFTMADLASRPEISVPAGRVPVLVSLKRQAAAQTMNANVTVSVWLKQQQVGGSIPVLALLCPALDAPTS